MAVTTAQPIAYKANIDGGRLVEVPVAASQTIYRGTYAIIGYDGYLYDATSSTRQAKRVVIPSVDATGGASDGLVKVMCYDAGTFVGTFTSLTAKSVGQACYLVDNATLDDTFANNCCIVGTITKYISATSGEFALNDFIPGQQIVVKKALTAAADNTAGAVFSLLNPLGIDCMVEKLVLKVDTAPTDTAAGVDFGLAANATTSNDTLIDGKVLAAAGYYSSGNSAGTNGGSDRKFVSNYYITGTSVVGSHYDLAALVGSAVITLRVI